MLAGSCPLPAALGEPNSGRSTACKVGLAATGGWQNNFFASSSVQNKMTCLQNKWSVPIQNGQTT
ncbi:unnamed protein product [Porites evermanni]|uniref:Uncharacterized protein n=1 Tax=Porites evermanni TaxID=104178 RepID=A0ABN8RZN2_9CNID|nr:unnamed protein product [Porites evermanni]